MNVSVRVEDADWAAAPGLEAGAARACETAWRKLGEASEAAVAVLLTSDAAVAALNQRWRGKSGATNVLSFPAPAFPGPQRHLGDIALASGTVAREAAAQGKSLEEHAIHLILHGCLHLLGHDHMTDTEAQAMESLEIEILVGLGIGNPYLEHDERR